MTVSTAGDTWKNIQGIPVKFGEKKIKKKTVKGQNNTILQFI